MSGAKLLHRYIAPAGWRDAPEGVGLDVFLSEDGKMLIFRSPANGQAFGQNRRDYMMERLGQWGLDPTPVVLALAAFDEQRRLAQEALVELQVALQEAGIEYLDASVVGEQVQLRLAPLEAAGLAGWCRK